MISYAYDNAHHCRKTFKDKNLRPEDIKSTRNYEKIPVLNHDDIRRTLNFLISACNYQGLFRCQTAGTTGHPLTVYKNKNELGSANACLFRPRAPAIHIQ